MDGDPCRSSTIIGIKSNKIMQLLKTVIYPHNSFSSDNIF